MEGVEVLFSILSVVLLGLYLYLLWRQYASVGKALVLSLGLVMLESHLFHVFFGEELAGQQCAGVDEFAVFGFWKCARWSYDFLFDSYEITVSISITLMASLMLIHIGPERLFAFISLLLKICLSLLLMLLPLEYMLSFYATLYNYVSALLALGIVVDEVFRIWYKEVDYEALEPEA